MFERVGIKDVTAAKNGKEAVDLHRINGQSFDLILMDKDMPIMNGIQATKELRSTGISSKIIGVSSSSREESNVQEFVEAGLDDYYMKPLTEEMLREILDKIKP
ncbi:hypothetical protein AAZX31_19G155700 [Glycine max]|uniref:Two-component response regulator 24 n=2 Tax=Glycine subgen. Soja TaxID=1462606 RepID=A0A445FHQ4_GLYSO|nr:two-component response regulator 24 [Glycine max]XP_028216770.1 two-component response regulator 24-like [Glycine soja]KAG4913290.1 hypothetical protein JHK86_053723 [Glycine max]KAG4928187.1 hypothetical protein JHK85_054673 [Glycine max]KAG5083708.1 hypothetical protein JHK84_053746 [Glycine max]KAH1078241.1 hypothetical protein GYH30_053318 [Glycine max]KAH1195085.1 Two-component response regulator 24 [Glycine max]|eukprot:XP_003553515.1 two-component response regulator 24 [Glycine max]